MGASEAFASATFRVRNPPELPERERRDEGYPDLSGTSLERITEVLVSVARGDFAARAPRSYSGDPWDVLAFLVNATAEEVDHLVEQREQEREELRQARDQLVQSEKLAALGELAGGVAHELNQPLTAIAVLTELLLANPEKTIAEQREPLELIAVAAGRMGRIVSAIRMFGRPAPLRLEPTDVREPVRSSLELMQQSLDVAAVRIQLDVDPALPRVAADSECLQQVFINLLSNARDALEEVAEDAPRAIRISIRRGASTVAVAVEDTGPGVPKEVENRIFDPFFTTKTVGRGTGLGLSICHGIVSEHRGTLRYGRGPGGGPCFTVELPLVEPPTSAPSTEEEERIA